MPSHASVDVDLFDHDAVRTLLVRMERKLAEQQATIMAHEQKLSSRDLEIAHLRLQIEKMRQERYGASSEKIDRHIDQLALKLEELESEQAAEEIVSSKSEPTAKHKPVRRHLPEHLHRDVITHEPTESCCPDCGSELRKLGEDISEYLERVPETFKVVQHVRIKMCCTGCDRILQPAMPTRPIERCLAGPALLAHVLTAKYANHFPLNRQAEIYTREGVDLDRSTLAGWVGASSQLLAPLVDSLRQHVMAAEKIHADDTPVPVLAPGHGRTRAGRLWTYVRDDRPAGSEQPAAVWFAYSPDRKGIHPQQHLKSFSGVLQADAYAGFSHLYHSGSILEAACMAHARRKFHDIHAVHPNPITTETLARIGALYDIEAGIRGQSAEQRREVRQQRAGPLLEAFRRWLEQKLATLSAKSDTAAAIRYALSRWQALTRYVDDGRIEIDNNAAERALRAVAIGRKNYLFAGSDSGGQRAAAIYSLVGTAKLNGLDPEFYLRTVLETIADHPINRIQDLLPWNIQTHTTSA